MRACACVRACVRVFVAQVLLVPRHALSAEKLDSSAVSLDAFLGVLVEDALRKYDSDSNGALEAEEARATHSHPQPPTAARTRLVTSPHTHNCARIAHTHQPATVSCQRWLSSPDGAPWAGVEGRWLLRAWQFVAFAKENSFLSSWFGHLVSSGKRAAWSYKDDLTL